ncbi:MAG TPA: EscU/YscU/HrcU family type III secretion system export apparatus switch protein [Polyangiaceae bacterium]|nr:EscU/YscU/HrcU family type III secretion system export apparatus switch protein [Polyangiaceae bacterium]
MASEHRTEPPSPRRLRKARSEGDHPISPLAIQLGALALAVLAAPLALAALRADALELLSEALRPGAAAEPRALALRVGSLAAPLLALAAAGALLVGLAQTGGAMSAKPLRWSGRRLNPFASSRSWAERGVSGAIATVVAVALLVAGWLVLKDLAPALAGTVGDGSASLQLALEGMRRLAWSALGVSLAAAGVDTVARRLAWLRRHRMTRDEVRRERREAEGDPELRQARRDVHRELASAGTARELARTTLLVLAEPRLAVGLAYDAERDRAPRVTVQGSGGLALTLEALAPSFGVPICRDTALARALAAVPVGQEVPTTLYADVARALSRARAARD